MNNALDRDHDGSILNDPSQAAARQQEGGSILDHIFGGQKATVENQLSQNTGISMDKIVTTIAQELGVKNNQVENTIKLIDEGNTIPFIARYRKEVTGGLSDETLRDLGERLTYLRNLEQRKEEMN